MLRNCVNLEEKTNEDEALSRIAKSRDGAVLMTLISESAGLILERVMGSEQDSPTLRGQYRFATELLALLQKARDRQG